MPITGIISYILAVNDSSGDGSDADRVPELRLAEKPAVSPGFEWKRRRIWRQQLISVGSPKLNPVNPDPSIGRGIQLL